MNVSLNAERALYVIPAGGGYTCFGFANARDHAGQIAERLQRPSLAFDADDFGTLAGYAKYQAAVQAWAGSPQSRQTYFDPGTDPKAARVLERCRREDTKVRLILGCWRRSKFDPPCRLNFDPGLGAGIG